MTVRVTQVPADVIVSTPASRRVRVEVVVVDVIVQVNPPVPVAVGWTIGAIRIA
jgi:hypothetical protein